MYIKPFYMTPPPLKSKQISFAGYASAADWHHGLEQIQESVIFQLHNYCVCLGIHASYSKQTFTEIHVYSCIYHRPIQMGDTSGET